MGRINVHGPGGFEGWFDDSKAVRWAAGTGPQWQALWRAATGRWLIEDPPGQHRFITEGQAAQWLARHGFDGGISEFIVRPGQHPGRPAIGGEVKVRLGTLLPEVDRFAAGHRITRAGAVRALVHRGLRATEETR